MSKLFERIEIPKIDLSGVDVMIKGVETELDRIVKDIVDRQDNAMAMEFTRAIGELLKANGVSVKITGHHTENCATNKFEMRYGCSIDGLDFYEHDKEFEDKISHLESKLSRWENLIDKQSKSIIELGIKLESKETDLPFDPLETANYLINLNYERETSSMERAIGRPNKIIVDKYRIDDLEQIAEHLLVYCKHNREIE